MEKIVNCTKKCPLYCTLKSPIRCKSDTTGKLNRPKGIASKFDIEIESITDK